jgi:hypothetical protein
MKEFTLEIRDVRSGIIHLNPADLSAIGAGEKMACRVIDPMTMRETVVLAKADDTVPEGTFASNRELTFQLGIEDGFNCFIDKFDKRPTTLQSVVLRIDSLADKEVDFAKYMTEDRELVLKALEGKVMRKNMPLPITDLGISVEISASSPELGLDEFAIFEGVNEIKITQKYGNYFNGILLIDASDSMLSEKPENMMNTIKNEEFLRQLREIGGNVGQFIDERIKDRAKIRRFDAAILAILGFFRVKVAKGRGEKIAIILYSTKAETVPVKGDNGDMLWISGGTEGEEMQRRLITSIMERVKNMGSAQTNLEAAMREAHRVAELMLATEIQDKNRPIDINGKPIPNPLVVMLLTDGKRTVGGAPVPIVKELFSSRERAILHTIGLGDDVEESELREIARLCRGRYRRTSDAQELFMFYDKEASDFSSIKSRSAIEDLLYSTKVDGGK